MRLETANLIQLGPAVCGANSDEFKQTSSSAAVPSVGQQSNKGGEEHKEADTGEGKSHPGGHTDRQAEHTLSFNMGSYNRTNSDRRGSMLDVHLIN